MKVFWLLLAAFFIVFWLYISLKALFCFFMALVSLKNKDKDSAWRYGLTCIWCGGFCIYTCYVYDSKFMGIDKALGEILEAYKEDLSAFVPFVVILIFIVCFIFWYRGEMKKRLKYARFVSHKYIEAVRKADDAERELASMQDGYSSFVKQKEEEVKELKERASRYREEFEALTANAQEDAFRSDSVVGHFTRASQKLNAHTLVSSSDWEALNMSASRLIPGFYNSISRDGRLTEREKSVAILLWLNFRESQISALLNITPQSTTNLKSRINERLFSDSRASTLKGRLKSIGVDEGQAS